MNKTTQKYIFITIIGIILLIASITVVTYAFLNNEAVQEESNILSTLDCMEVSITGTSDELNLVNAYPLTDIQGKKSTPYTFKVSNNCQTYVEYKIIMSLLNDSTLTNEEYIKVSLNGPRNLKPSSLDILEKESSVFIIENTINNYVLEKGNFESNDEHTYDFRMWLNSDNELIWEDENIANKNIFVKLSIVAVTTHKPDQIENILTNEETNTPYLKGLINKDQIESIEFSTNKEVPVNALGSWDVSDNNNNSIIAWYENSDTEGMYKVTIGQNAGVIANNDSSYLFSNLENLKTINFNNFNARFVTNMSYMFNNIGVLSDSINLIGIESLDTSGVTNMSHMFAGINKIDLNFDFSSWNTSNLENSSYMFNNSTLSTINLSNWDINKVLNMDNMFDTSSFQSLRLEKWEIPNSTKNQMLNNISLNSEIYVNNENLKDWIITNTNIPEGINITSLN